MIPVTNVDREVDGLPLDFEASEEYAGMSPECRFAWSVYDAEKMHGLPLNVQVVGRRFEEEKVLAGMKVIEEVLKRKNVVFKSKKDML